MAEELIALIDGHELGRLSKAGGELHLEYSTAWLALESANHPLSVSLPLASAHHAGVALESYLWGLLPDRLETLHSLCRTHRIKMNSFDLVAVLGEDLPGAIAFVLPERVDAFTTGPTPKTHWMDDTEIAHRLAALRKDPSAFRRATDRGRFSLAGAQPKTAFLEENGRWGVPAGRRPTSHILKPPIVGLAGVLENEHFCLQLAREAGIQAAKSRVQWFENECVIVVERYDRVRDRGEIFRIHQEDFCQALSIHPAKKYQAEGGPAPVDIARILRAYSSEPSEDLRHFFEALVFQWLTLGTDGHAKNYSILIAAEGCRLAPLYDLISGLPYTEPPWRKEKLAMTVGGEYKPIKLFRRHWRKLARDLQLDEELAEAVVLELADEMPDLVEDVRRQAVDDGLDQGVVDRLAGELQRWLEFCRRQLAAGQA